MIRRINYILCATTLCTLLLTGCNKDTSPIGATLVASSQFDLSLIDTVRLRASTVAYDSIVTSSTFLTTNQVSGRLLVGHHEDPKLGGITVSSVFQLTPPTFFDLDPHQTVYKSLSIFLLQDGYSYYDTTQTMTLNIYRLTKPVVYYSGYRYNKDTYSIADSSLLGTITFQPRPHLKDSVEIFLPDELGQEIIELMHTSDPILSTSDNFAKVFYGFALVPDTTQNTAILGFKPSPVMRLTYYDNSVLPSVQRQKRALFNFTVLNQYYNKFDNDRSGTKLAGLNGLGDEVVSGNSDNEAYLQAGAGLNLRLIPTNIKNLAFIHEGFVATRALLTLTPVWQPEYRTTPLPTSLTVDLIDQFNGTLASAYLTAFLTTDAFGNYNYSVDVTSYINGEVTSGANTTNALLFKIPSTDFGSTVNRLYIGDQGSAFRMKLSIYYLTLLEQ